MTSTERVPALLVGLAAALALGCPTTSDEPESSVISSVPCEACGGACVVENLALDAATHHTDPLVYDDPPPAGGPHNSCWAEWGVHDTELDDDHWVHNLEHGGVVYLYDCPAGCPDAVAQLEEIVAAREAGSVIVSPYAALEGGFAAVAWGSRLLTDCFDRATFDAFYDDHFDQAPESVRSGPPSSCDDALAD